MTSVENPLPVDPDTIFQIGAITKTVTATAIMVLSERGMLDLDDPVRNYLPDLRLADEEVARRRSPPRTFSRTSAAGWETSWRIPDAATTPWRRS